MADKMDSHLTLDDDDDDDTAKDLMTFCMQLIHHSQWKPRRVFYSGSFVEMPLTWFIVASFNISKECLDIDVMIYNTFHYAFHRSAALPETYTGDIIRIYSEDVHTGYVRLIREKDNRELQLTDVYKILTDEVIHGPAVLSDYRKSMDNKFSLSDAETDIVETEKGGFGFYDLVNAVHSPYWPVEAGEWITRRRLHGFPSKSVIKQVVRYGCDFVQVSHSRNTNDNEWRFSFSRAELFIATSWTRPQRIVYDTLWVLGKKLAGSKLCTYYFKTLMFWACEEKPRKFWRDLFLFQSVCELFMDMMKCLKLKFCANYFILSNNMMDHLIDADLSVELDAVWTTLQSRQLITDVINTCREGELLYAHTLRHIESPAWIKRAYIILQRVNSEYDNYSDIFCKDISTDLQNALYVEFSDIYKGLCFHKKSASCFVESKRHIYSSNSENHLRFAGNLRESQKRELILNCSRELRQPMLERFISTNKLSKPSTDNVEMNPLVKSIAAHADLQNSSNDLSEQKCLLYSRYVEKHENKMVHNNWREKIIESRNINIAMYAVTTINHNTEYHDDFYKVWPGRSPTVNISWFIAQAYLANLYYTTQRDVSLTLKTCDNIIDVYRQSLTNQDFAEKTFPVVLSTQWTSIYDNEIQNLLGFYFLSSYVFGAKSRSVYLGVCPVQFALYFKLRIARDYGRFDMIPEKDKFKEHTDTCFCLSQTKNGTNVLYRSLLLHKVKKGLQFS